MSKIDASTAAPDPECQMKGCTMTQDTIKEVALLPGDEQEDAAFDLAKMERAGINNLDMTEALTALFAVLKHFLRDGHGVALVRHDDNYTSVIGVRLVEDGDA